MSLFFGNRNHGTLFSTLPKLRHLSHNLMNELKSINSLLITLNSDELVRTILYGDKKFHNDPDLKI